MPAQRSLVSPMAKRERQTGIGTFGWHRQTRTDSPGGQIEVDTKMVALLRRLWSHGYTTVASCQSAGNSGWAWIRLDRDVEAQRLAASVDPARRPAADGSDVTFVNMPTLDPDAVLTRKPTDASETSRSGPR